MGVSLLRLALRVALPMGLVSVALFRAVDCVYFSVVLNAFLDPDALLLLANVVAGAIIVLSCVRPLLGSMVAVLALAAVKQAADGAMPAPQLSPTPLVALVTGANSGIGLKVSEELLRQGHTVILGCRSADRCARAAEALAQRTASSPGSTKGRALPLGGLELSRLSDVATWARSVRGLLAQEKLPPISLLVANAGYVPIRNTTTTGFEDGLYSMLVGHHAVFRYLEDSTPLPDTTAAIAGPALAEGLNVVVVASDAMRFGAFHESLTESPSWSEGGDADLRGQVTTGCSLPPLNIVMPFCVPPKFGAGMRPGIRQAMLPHGLTYGAYARAKLANVLWARELHRRGVVGRATSVMPGIVCTNIMVNEDYRHLSLPDLFHDLVCPLTGRPASVAANVVISAATGPLQSQGPALDGFHYFSGRGLSLGSDSLTFDSPDWMDRAARALWDFAEAQVALTPL